MLLGCLHQNNWGYIMEQEIQLCEEPNQCSFSDGWLWIKQAFSLSLERSGTWMFMSFIMCLCLGVVLIVSVKAVSSMTAFVLINQVFGGFLMCGFMGGLMVSMASFSEEEDLKISYLFTGFQYKFLDLLILFGCFLLMTVGLVFASYIVLVLVGVNELLLKLATMFIFAFSLMGSWLALPLVMLQDVKPLTAIQMSITGSLKNILPILCVFLLTVLLMVVLLVVAAIGWGDILSDRTLSKTRFLMFLLFLLLPIVNVAFAYSAYRNIWTNLPLK